MTEKLENQRTIKILKKVNYCQKENRIRIVYCVRPILIFGSHSDGKKSKMKFPGLFMNEIFQQTRDFSCCKIECYRGII